MRARNPCGIAVTPTQAATPATHGLRRDDRRSESDIQSFAIANTASSVLDVTSVTLTGADPGQFQITGDGCSPIATSPGLELLRQRRVQPNR